MFQGILPIVTTKEQTAFVLPPAKLFPPPPPPPPPCEVCQYSDPMLKHLPQKSLDNIEKVLLFRKKKVTYRGNIEKRANNSNVPADITDEDFDNRINRFANLINPEENYRIP